MNTKEPTPAELIALSGIEKPKCDERRYRVRGIAMVPVEANAEVIASSNEEAMRLAKRLFADDPRRYIVRNSEDYSAAWDWEPDAEELL